MVFERVCELIVEQLDVEAEEITPDSRLTEDLRADSVDVMSVVFALESEYDVQFDFDNLEKIKTVGDAVAYIEKNIQ